MNSGDALGESQFANSDIFGQHWLMSWPILRPWFFAIQIGSIWRDRSAWRVCQVPDHEMKVMVCHTRLPDYPYYCFLIFRKALPHLWLHPGSSRSLSLSLSRQNLILRVVFDPTSSDYKWGCSMMAISWISIPMIGSCALMIMISPWSIYPLLMEISGCRVFPNVKSGLLC